MKTYRREDGLLMVEVEPGYAVNIVSAPRLGLIATESDITELDRPGHRHAERVT